MGFGIIWVMVQNSEVLQAWCSQESWHSLKLLACRQPDIIFIIFNEASGVYG